MRRSAAHRRQQERLRSALREIRNSQGLTQAALSRVLGRPQSFVSKVESGERRLDVVEFIDVAKALKVDPVRLLRHLLAD